MVKYIVSYGEHNVFSMMIAAITKKDKKGNLSPDFPAMFKHVKAIVGNDATVELA